MRFENGSGKVVEGGTWPRNTQLTFFSIPTEFTVGVERWQRRLATTNAQTCLSTRIYRNRDWISCLRYLWRLRQRYLCVWEKSEFEISVKPPIFYKRLLSGFALSVPSCADQSIPSEPIRNCSVHGILTKKGGNSVFDRMA